jgi:hypothetical protein
MADITDKAHGKGWDQIATYILTECSTLLGAGYGVMFVGHLQERVVTVNGKESVEYRPGVQDSLWRKIAQIVQYIMHMTRTHVMDPDTQRRTLVWALETSETDMGPGGRYIKQRLPIEPVIPIFDRDRGWDYFAEEYQRAIESLREGKPANKTT